MYKAFDQVVNDLVVHKYNEDPRQGIKAIYMNLNYDIGLVISESTIYRYMKINALESITRTKKRTYERAVYEGIPNHIMRYFEASGPNKKWSIDISYIKTGGGRLYLCAIKDMYDKSIVAYRLERFQDSNLVMNTLTDALEKVQYKDRTNLILHSDQGVQFRMNKYKAVLKQNNITHSVSFKGSSVDNAPIESWFSALKTESIYLKRMRTKQMAIDTINDYVYFYNFKRLQEKLGGLPPIEYRLLYS